MQQIKNILPGVIETLSQPQLATTQKLIAEWPRIAGPNIAKHSQPISEREGKLLICVDQPTLAFELNQKYRQALLKRIQAAVGEDTVRAIYFRVGQIR